MTALLPVLEPWAYAAVLGGVSMTGGKGSIALTLLGAMLITLIQNGMNVVGVDGLWQQIIFGSLLLAAIYLNSDRNHKGPDCKVGELTHDDL